MKKEIACKVSIKKMCKHCYTLTYKKKLKLFIFKLAKGSTNIIKASISKTYSGKNNAVRCKMKDLQIYFRLLMQFT